MKIDVLCRRELNSEGLGGSRNDRISRCFSRGVESAALGGTFAFVIFWCSRGSRMAQLSVKKTVF